MHVRRRGPDDVAGADRPIVNASVIPMDAERVISNATVIVRGDRIAWVGPTRDADIPSNSRSRRRPWGVRSAGVADMHVHTNERDMPLFLRNGGRSAS